ncbi:MAG: DUF3990 domain-containing protein [Desulfovibrionaceae bacterium]|nr:DUF3990 domain-containing protein [Desulfovibrionaceae bacterium]
MSTVNEQNIILYHGSKMIVKFPEIRLSLYNKDFYFGFYCTKLKEQAKRLALRYGSKGIINSYVYKYPNKCKIIKFEHMTEEWLDFIIACRSGKKHYYDIVEGPMANDRIYNYIQTYLDGEITCTAFWELAKFNKPTHQISFHTIEALTTLNFIEGYEIYA